MSFVIHVIDGLSLGGAQRLLTTLGSAGRKPVIVDLAGKRSLFSDQLEADGARILRVGARRAINPLDWWRVYRVLRREPSAVLHLHLTNAVLFGAPLGRLLGRKIVVTLHNTRTVRKTKWLSRAKAAVETAILRHLVDHVLHVGHEVEAANAGRLGPVAQRVPQTVLINVIVAKTPGAGFDRDALRQRLNAGPDDFVFVSTGRLSPQKDHDTMLRAIALLQKRIGGVRFWIAGAGPLQGALAQQIDALGIGAVAQLIGTATPIEEVLHAADGFVLSSAWEGLPLGLLEAMAAGLPVVATAVGDVPGLLAGDRGVLVPKSDPQALANALEQVATDPALRERLVAQAGQGVAPYLDVEGWIARTEAVYRSVVSG